MKKRQGGFSLIELIIAIAILVILTGLLAPQFMKYIESSRRARLMSDLQAIDEAIQIEYIAASDGGESVPINKRITIRFGVVTEGNADSELITKLIEGLKRNIGVSVVEKTVIELYPDSKNDGNSEDTLTNVDNILIKYYPNYPDYTFYFYAKGFGKEIPVPLEDATFGKGHGDEVKEQYDEKWQ